MSALTGLLKDIYDSVTSPSVPTQVVESIMSPPRNEIEEHQADLARAQFEIDCAQLSMAQPCFVSGDHVQQLDYQDAMIFGTGVTQIVLQQNYAEQVQQSAQMNGTQNAYVVPQPMIYGSSMPRDVMFNIQLEQLSRQGYQGALTEGSSIPPNNLWQTNLYPRDSVSLEEANRRIAQWTAEPLQAQNVNFEAFFGRIIRETDVSFAKKNSKPKRKLNLPDWF